MLENKKTSLIISIIFGFLIGTSLIIILPSNTPYSMANTGSLGLSKLAEELNATPIRLNVGELPSKPRDSAIIVIQQDRSSKVIVESIVRFAEEGGIIILSGDYNFIKSFIDIANLSIQVTPNIILDPVFKKGDRLHPILFGVGCHDTLIGYKPLALANNSRYQVLLESSQYSYIDKNNNKYLDLTENISRNIAGISINIGQGKIIIITSPRSFTNDLIKDNISFIKCIIDGRIVYIDQSQVESNPLETIRLTLKYGSNTNLKILILVLSSITGVVGYYVAEKYAR